MKKHLTVLNVLIFMMIIKHALCGGHSSWYRSSSGRSSMRSSVRLHGGRQFTSSSGSTSSMCGGAYFSSMSGMSGSTGNEDISAMLSSRRYISRTPPESSEEQQTNSNENSCSLTDCLPYIKTQEVIELSWSQKREAFCKTPFINTWRDADKLLQASSTILHTPIVTLNSEQKSKILSRYGNYFHDPDRTPPIPSTTIPPHHREKRSSSVNVCPREELWDALVLALTDDDELIQVIQIADATQWILMERCAQTHCNFVSSCQCTHHTRLVRAAVISFDQSQVVERYIKVYCCIGQILF
ncbi:uncharacterized protein LOC117295879 [Asterias rubens]|uniref:uncharacterized protein LOC117295879 n=1 Tax=Asterias rubens TaxID=7604 RepID=UPI0014555AE1|nr:uncharacterized protein LOC117295879 [Asterias rubens]